MATNSFQDHLEPALWLAFLAFSYKHSFYWTTSSISLLLTRLYYVVLIRMKTKDAGHCEPSDTVESPRQGRNILASLCSVGKWTGYAILLVWCCSLSPLHVLTPTFLDFWTNYLDHATFSSVDVLYEPGPGAVVEYEE
jgi:hypothetical protein